MHLSRYPATEAVTPEGRIPLSFAAGFGHEPFINSFLGRTELRETWLQPDLRNRSPLWYAVCEEHLNCAELLLPQSHGTHLGETSYILLSMALRKRSWAIIKWLIVHENLDDCPRFFGDEE